MCIRAAHFLMKGLPKVVSEMALQVLAYNPTRVLNILGVQPLMAALGRGEGAFIQFCKGKCCPSSSESSIRRPIGSGALPNLSRHSDLP
jgi:hypothetical protein